MALIEKARATLTVRVRDVAAAIDWYGTVFGVPPIYRGVDRSLEGKAEPIACFRLGGVKIWLSKMPAGRVRESADADLGMTLTFMTREPLADVRRDVIARGALVRDDEVKPDFPQDADGIRQGKDAAFFYIYDPDGNRFEFCRLQPGASTE